MSESKYSQNDKWDDRSLGHVISSVLRHKIMSVFFKKSLNRDGQSWLEGMKNQLPKHIYKHLSNQRVIWFLRTDNRIQSKTL